MTTRSVIADDALGLSLKEGRIFTLPSNSFEKLMFKKGLIKRRRRRRREGGGPEAEQIEEMLPGGRTDAVDTSDERSQIVSRVSRISYRLLEENGSIMLFELSEDFYQSKQTLAAL